ncbi:MOSC domain-containing protein [Sulfurovum sp.]|uniref:MOSC domain-containing protein n=1 Tax=Sulfurovum sp. TaxID=1969726 RepID=UPI0025D8EA90|nr:MOSC domain-containing protein [Sulfurovum sp.]
MKHVGEVLSLTISTTETRSPMEKHTIFVDTKGIVGDKHYNKDPERSILLTSIDSYLLAKNHSIQIPDHALGENLLIDYNPYKLSPGTRLQIGSAILEISQPCTLCKHLSCIDSKLPKLLKHDRGIFAKVIQTGEIKTGDSIAL